MVGRIVTGDTHQGGISKARGEGLLPLKPFFSKPIAKADKCRFIGPFLAGKVFFVMRKEGQLAFGKRGDGHPIVERFQKKEGEEGNPEENRHWIATPLE